MVNYPISGRISTRVFISARSPVVQKKRTMKPIIYAGSLVNPCNYKISLLSQGINGSVILPIYDSTRHNEYQEKIKRELRSNNFVVATEKWLICEFDRFILKHPIDIIATKRDDSLIRGIEIKPNDSAKYEPQYIASMLLMEHVFGERGDPWTFQVMTYYDNEIIPKILSDYELAEQKLCERVDKILDNEVLPIKGKYCEYCKYGQCEYNPHTNEVDDLLTEIFGKEVSPR